jgi:hypothetical protein
VITTAAIIFKILITISMPVPISYFTPVVQQSLKEVFAVAAGLTQEESYQVELIIRSATRRRLLTGNESIVDVLINMPNASSASAGTGRLTNTTINQGLAEIGLPPATIVSPPVVVTSVPDTTAAPVELATSPATTTASVSTQNLGFIQYISIHEGDHGLGFYIVWGTVLVGSMAILAVGVSTFCGNREQIFHYYYYYFDRTSHSEHRRHIPIPIEPARVPPEPHTPSDRRWSRYGYDRLPSTRPVLPPHAPSGDMFRHHHVPHPEPVEPFRHHHAPHPEPPHVIPVEPFRRHHLPHESPPGPFRHHVLDPSDHHASRHHVLDPSDNHASRHHVLDPSDNHASRHHLPFPDGPVRLPPISPFHHEFRVPPRWSR